jgi:hypothetical protein
MNEKFWASTHPKMVSMNCASMLFSIFFSISEVKSSILQLEPVMVQHTTKKAGNTKLAASAAAAAAQVPMTPTPGTTSGGGSSSAQPAVSFISIDL